MTTTFLIAFAARLIQACAFEIPGSTVLFPGPGHRVAREEQLLTRGYDWLLASGWVHGVSVIVDVLTSTPLLSFLA